MQVAARLRPMLRRGRRELTLAGAFEMTDADRFEAFVGEQPNYAPALARLQEMEAAVLEAPDDDRIVPFRRLPSAAAKSKSA